MRYKSVQLPEKMVEAVRRVIDERKELGYVSVKGFVEDAVRRRLEEIRKSRPARGVSCPACGGSVEMERVGDLNVIEYRGHCTGCLWSGILRKIRCGVCHGDQFFEWTGTDWRCIDCGHIRSDPSPPRDLILEAEGR